MTWNLWWRFGPWQERQPAIEATLAEADADVIALQEVYASDGDEPLDGDQAARLASSLGLYVARSVDAEGRALPFGNAVLSRWPILSASTLRLEGADGGAGHRSAVFAELDAPHGRQLVVSTHLEWRYEASELRCRQLAQICAAIAARRRVGPDGAVDDPGPLLLGDLNATPDSDEVRRLTGASVPFAPGLVFTDVWAAVGDGPGLTWERTNPHAAEASWPRRRLDYVLVGWPRPKPLGNPVAARLAGGIDDPSPERCGSDHWAVLAELDGRRP